jgi:4'-phosphopantetheinyl transferase
MTADETDPRVELWWLELSEWQPYVSNAELLLSADERERASRFRFERHRNQYVLVRAVLRHLLGHYLERAPAAVRFEYNHAGKPDLATDGDSVSFNVSHSENIGLFGFGFRCRVGVDVEYMKPDINVHALAQHSFSTSEQQALRHLTEVDLAAGFYRCWTRKEAYIKALGDGISYGLDRFDVSLEPGESRLLADRNRNGENHWTFSELTLRPDYAAAAVGNARNFYLVVEQLQPHSVFGAPQREFVSTRKYSPI